MPDKLEKLHLYICVAAALIVTVISILRHETLYRMSVWVSVTIIVFYGIGWIIRTFLMNLFLQQQEKDRRADAEAAEGEKGDSDLTDTHDTDGAD